MMKQNNISSPKVATRTCLVCKTKAPRAELLRFVREGKNLLFDEHKCLSGRGMWVCADCAPEALAKNPFNKAARRQVFYTQELLELVQKYLSQSKETLLKGE